MLFRSHPKTTGCRRLIFCLNETISNAAMVALNVAIMQGRNISVGLAAAGVTDALMAMMLMGMSVSPEACNTINMICALVAVSLFGFNSCKLCIAFNPKGVAALSSPKRFAEKFMIMCPNAGCLSGTSGNNLLKKGPTILERNLKIGRAHV